MMIYTQPTDHHAPLSELALWLIGIPMSGLLALFIYSNLPRAIDGRIDSLLSSGVCALALLLLVWNLAWSALAYFASLSALPRLVKHSLVRLISAIGTQQAKQIIMRSGAGATIGLTLMTSGFSGIACAATTDAPSNSQSASNTDYDLSWGALQSDSSTQSNSPNVPASTPSESTPTARSQPPTSTKSLAPTTAHPTTAPEPIASSPPPNSSKETSSPIDRITVEPGQSLWSISAAVLGPNASDSDIAAFWPKLYSLNCETIGEDPHLIHPGQELTLPKGQP